MDSSAARTPRWFCPFLAGPRLAVVGLLLVSLVSSGCSRPPASGQGQQPVDRLGEIVTRGELRVGYLVWDPCVIRERPGAPLAGIYPDMFAEIAKALGVKLSWHETTLANFSAGLSAGQFDVFAGAVFVTIPRAAAVAYTDPVAFLGNSGVVASTGGLRPRAASDLNVSTVRIAVLQGQALEEFARRSFPNAQLVSIAGGDLTAPLAAVSAGRADIGFMNSATVDRYVAEHPELTAVFTGGDQLEILPLAWAVRPSDQTLVNFLNAAIAYLDSTGRTAEYQRRYGVQLLYRQRAPAPLPVAPAVR